MFQCIITLVWYYWNESNVILLTFFLEEYINFQFFYKSLQHFESEALKIGAVDKVSAVDIGQTDCFDGEAHHAGQPTPQHKSDCLWSYH